MIKGVGVSGKQSRTENSEEHGPIIYSLTVSLSVRFTDNIPQKSILNLKEILETSSFC